MVKSEDIIYTKCILVLSIKAGYINIYIYICVCVCVFIKACVHTSSICQAAIIANRTEVLKNEHSHG